MSHTTDRIYELHLLSMLEHKLWFILHSAFPFLVIKTHIYLLLFYINAKIMQFLQIKFAYIIFFV